MENVKQYSEDWISSIIIGSYIGCISNHSQGFTDHSASAILKNLVMDQEHFNKMINIDSLGQRIIQHTL